MDRNYAVKFVLVCFCLIFSCSEIDDNTAAVSAKTNPDNIVITQNSVQQIYILSNDNNLPQTGSLSVTNPTLGVLQVNDNNSPDNPSDDFVIYSAYPNTIGNDSFQYTVCDNFGSCKTENVTINITSLSVVHAFGENSPHATLSEYNFFSGDLKNLNPTFGVVPYDLITPLFSDYAKKKRFIWMPNGVRGNYNGDHSPLDLPTGTILIKNFFYNNVQPSNETKLIETRLMYKKPTGWDFANYVWNDEQTEAFFTNQGSTLNLSWLEGESLKSTNYRVPSRAECFTCHNQLDQPTPIGFKPQNINKDFAFPDGISNQLRKLSEIGYIESDFPSNIITTVDWKDDAQPLDERVRSYLDINCAHCHSDFGHCNYRPMRFEFQFTSDPENIGVCIEPETQFIPNSYIVKPNNTDLSILYYRLSTTDESFRMPLLGRTINHDEGIALIEEWIATLTNCN